MTDQLRKAAEMALDALDSCELDYDWEERPYKTFDEILVNDAVDALRQALAQNANKSDCGHTEYKPLCQMCMATKQKPERNT